MNSSNEFKDMFVYKYSFKTVYPNSLKFSNNSKYLVVASENNINIYET